MNQVTGANQRGKKAVLPITVTLKRNRAHINNQKDETGLSKSV